jgi:hypothetical protein
MELDMAKQLTDMEKATIEEAINRAGGCMTKAAKELNLSFRQIRYRAHKYGILEPGVKPGAQAAPKQTPWVGVYFLQCPIEPKLIKLGFSTNVRKRVRNIGFMGPVPLDFLGYMPGTMGDETKLKIRFRLAREHGEWFRPVPELLRFIESAIIKAPPAPEPTFLGEGI